MRGKASTAFASALLAVTAAPPTGQGSDGNPHGWDRRRRCDGIAYDPPCGICEGVGGVPFGDRNEEIALASCAPAGEDAHPAPRRPIWAAEMQVEPYYSVQIGPKLDPFCFQAIPSNTSAGPLCYQEQSGSQLYDFASGADVLQFDVHLSTALGAVDSTVVARDTDLWIVNTLPWYALKARQCICTSPREGASAASPAVRPLSPKWTTRLRLVGVERIGVEYGSPIRTLAHWVYGPHHVWTVPDSGSIVRMWQPYNGLQVMPNGTLPSAIAPARRSAIPPPECVSRFAFRIGCDAAGYPVGHEPRPSTRDAGRAHATVPREALRADHAKGVARTLNRWLGAAPGARPCEEWALEELDGLMDRMEPLRDERAGALYRRRLDPREGGDGSFEARRARRRRLRSLNASEDELELLRDGLCHEVAMWYAHQLGGDGRAQLHMEEGGVPLLPSGGVRACDACRPEVREAYEAQVTCLDCHMAG